MSIQKLLHDVLTHEGGLEAILKGGGSHLRGVALIRVPHGPVNDDEDSVPDGTPSTERYEACKEFSEDAENHYVRLALGPGVAPDQVQVKLKNGTVHIEANYQRKLRPGEKVHHSEIAYGIIEAEVRPPDGVADLEKLRAEFFNGLLILTLPKVKAAAPEAGPETSVNVNVIR